MQSVMMLVPDPDPIPECSRHSLTTLRLSELRLREHSANLLSAGVLGMYRHQQKWMAQGPKYLVL